MARLLILIFAGLAFSAPAENSKPPKPPSAKLKITGGGFLRDRQLKKLVLLLELEKKKPEFFDANFIEDSALILISRLHDEGYLSARLAAEVTLQNGRQLTWKWNGTLAEPLPRPILARQVVFQIDRGVLYHYTRIEFAGLAAVSARRATAFFMETSGLFQLKRNRIYSPQRLKRSLSNLDEILDRLGYPNATVKVGRLVRNDRTGGVALRVEVEQGQRFLVSSVRRTVFYGSVQAPQEAGTNYFLRPFSKLWQQDFIQGMKTNYYRRGYPDTSVDLRVLRQQPVGNWVLVHLLAQVQTGPRVRVGQVIFQGNLQTRESLLSARVRIKPGDWLDRMEAEEGRYRLSRLGVFDLVDLNYQPKDTNLWNVVYHMKEGRRIDISPLVGFGSYDLLRAGVEINQYNLWGLAHNSRLRLIQSFKSSSGDYTYTVPEFLGEDADLFFNASGLRRQEISFTRVEYGGGVGVRRLFRKLSTDATLRYNYGILEATETSADFAPQGAQNPTVGSIISDIRHDRRDNPLYPRRGYEVMVNLEFATQYLGGDVNYQRIELSGSYHWPLNGSEWIHLGLRHGAVSTVGPPSKDLPFTRRFFPGGEDSVRGFQEGEASPRNAQGKIIGAETYTSGSIEFEQALTPKWSVVGFLDGVEFAQNLSQYPGNQALFSAGGGLRWRTLIGPVRFEYGYNLNPRRFDPSGTFQFALGFPF